ncbi:hypothetical protein M758_4G131900 [Ceratodon purpureus]|nr:hypothetical protein M758_4G131900 [Ceratodon purpureus]
MFVAGTDTTTIITEWILAELLHHPHIQSKLQIELDTIIGTKRMVEEADLSNLTYLHAVICEGYCLHPSAPLMLPHSNLEPCKVDGYYISANSHVFINIWAICRDPTIWNSPESFNPERFCKTNTQADVQIGNERSMVEIDYKGLDFELLPFGYGRRICPTMQSATLTVSLAVAQLVHGFRWTLTDGHASIDMDMRERFTLSLQMKSPLYRVCCEARLHMKVYGSL